MALHSLTIECGKALTVFPAELWQLVEFRVMPVCSKAAKTHVMCGALFLHRWVKTVCNSLAAIMR